MVGSFAGCCTRAATGHAAAAPPSSVTNSRRFIAFPRAICGRTLTSAGRNAPSFWGPLADIRRCGKFRHEMQLLDHLVGAGEQHGRNLDAERLGGLQVDDQLKSGRLLDRNIGWPCPTQNLIYEFGATPELS